MTLGDPNRFDGPVRLRTRGTDEWLDVPFRGDPTVGRGIGLADFIDAIREDRPARASATLAFHVLDVLLSIETAVGVRHASVVDRRRPSNAAAPLGRAAPTQPRGERSGASRAGRRCRPRSRGS